MCRESHRDLCQAGSLITLPTQLQAAHNRESQVLLQGSTHIFEKSSLQFCIYRVNVHSFQTQPHRHSVNGYKHPSASHDRR